MNEIRNIQLKGSEGRPFLLDVLYEETGDQKPVVVFCHGFKGFKDWGSFDLVAKEFASQGCVFVKMNFSHNGTTPEKPVDFVDLKAFGNNNFSKELFDLGQTLDWLYKNEDLAPEMDLNSLALVGHSRGGGTVLLKAAEDLRVKRVISWAGVCDFSYFIPADGMEAWEKEGVTFVFNGRTKQQMPLYWQLCDDFYRNKARLDIPSNTARLSIPQLIIHGDKDTSVPLDFAFELKKYNPRAEMVIIQNGDHTFGSTHPWDSPDLPAEMQQVVKVSVEFLS